MLAWLGPIRRAKAAKGAILVSLAERGDYQSAIRGFAVEMRSVPTMGYAAKELAIEVGVIRPRWGDDTWPKDDGATVALAQELDRKL